jgi:hypothetical protein
MFPDEYVSFVVRCWREPADNEPCGRWHGEIEQIQSGVRWSFGTLADLLAFLNQAVDAPQAVRSPEVTSRAMNDKHVENARVDML